MLKANFIAAGFGSLVSALSQLLTIKFIVLDLGLEGYGSFAIIQNLPIFLSVILGLRTSETIFSYKGIDNLSCISGAVFFGLIVWGLGLAGIYFSVGREALQFYYSEFNEIVWLGVGVVLLVYIFNDFSVAVMRVFDRFKAVALADVIFKVAFFIIILVVWGSEADLGVLDYFMLWVILAFLYQMFLLLYAIRLLSFDAGVVVQTFRVVKVEWRRMLPMLFHSNLIGYFKITSSPGDVFILGAFSSSYYVAVYNMAKSLMGVFYIGQNVLSSVLTPYLIGLFRKQKKLLFEFLRKYLIVSTTIFLFTALIFWVAGDYLVAKVYGEENREVFFVAALMLVHLSITIISLCYYALSIAYGSLRSRTLVLAIKLVSTIALISLFSVTPYLLLCIEIAFAVLIRILNDYPLHRKLASDV